MSWIKDWYESTFNKKSDKTLTLEKVVKELEEWFEGTNQVKILGQGKFNGNAKQNYIIRAHIPDKYFPFLDKKLEQLRAAFGYLIYFDIVSNDTTLTYIHLRIH